MTQKDIFLIQQVAVPFRKWQEKNTNNLSLSPTVVNLLDGKQLMQQATINHAITESQLPYDY